MDSLIYSKPQIHLGSGARSIHNSHATVEVIGIACLEGWYYNLLCSQLGSPLGAFSGTGALSGTIWSHESQPEWRVLLA